MTMVPIRLQRVQPPPHRLFILTPQLSHHPRHASHRRLGRRRLGRRLNLTYRRRRRQRSTCNLGRHKVNPLLHAHAHSCTCVTPLLISFATFVSDSAVPPRTIEEQTAVDAARLQRLCKHERMRALLRWITAAHFSGKQIRLADALKVSGPWLSQYLKDRDQRGKAFDCRQLNDRCSSISHALVRAELPTEIPTVEQVAAAATLASAASAATTANTRQSQPAKPSAAAPVFTAPTTTPPKAAVLSVNLADVEGRLEGGQCHIMALGVPVLGDGRWVMACPGGSEGADVLRLRVGLRGRRTLSARCHASIAGRTFEWWIEVLECRHDIAIHGGPLWVAREVSTNLSSLGQRIVGRAALERGSYCGPSSPELLWKAISRYCGPEAPRLPGVVNTGLIHPSVHALLLVVEEEGDGLPSLSGFGSRSGGVGGLKERRLREIGAAAGVAFVQAMESVCPGEPEAAFAQLLKRRSFQSYLPDHMRKALGPTALRDAALKLPFVAGLVDVYHKLEGFRTRRQHLSLFAPFFPYSVTQSLFGVTRWQVSYRPCSCHACPRPCHAFQTAAGKSVELLIPGGEERTPLRRRVALPHSRHQITALGCVLPS
jgi:hypothetical protein